MRLSLVVIFAFVLSICASVANAQVSWPSSNDWWPLLFGGNVHTEPDDETPDWADIRGSATHPGGYWFFEDGATLLDTSDDLLMFRLRIDAKPPNDNSCQTVFQVLFDIYPNTDPGGADIIDWTLQVDRSSDDQLEMLPAIIGGPTFSIQDLQFDVDQHVVIEKPADITNATYFRCTYPTDSQGGPFDSEFDGDDDGFLDMAVPWDTFVSTVSKPGFTVTQNTTFGVALTTSANHNNTNKDIPGPGAIVTSDPTAVPEPGTLALVGFGLMALVGYAKRRKDGTG